MWSGSIQSSAPCGAYHSNGEPRIIACCVIGVPRLTGNVPTTSRSLWTDTGGAWPSPATRTTTSTCVCARAVRHGLVDQLAGHAEVGDGNEHGHRTPRSRWKYRPRVPWGT